MPAATVPLTRTAELPAPPGLPLIGNAHQIRLPLFHQQLEAWQRTYGDVYRMRIWARQFVVFADPHVAAEALRERPGTFSRTERVSTAATEMGFGGLFASNGEKWRRQRPMVMAAFDPGHIKRYFPSLVQVSTRLAARWERAARSGTPVPLQQDLMRFTVDVIAGLAFGTDINTLEGEQDVIQRHMDQIFPMLFPRTLAPLPYWRHFKLPADRRLDVHLQAFRAAVQDFIAAARERMRADPALRDAPTNLIEAMLAARDRPGHGLTDEDVAANVATMLLAGEDTTAHTLAWMLWLLAQHPPLLQRARDEVRQALGDETLPTRIEQVASLRFVGACAPGTMRLKPVAPLLPQQAAHDTSVAGVTIPEGTLCIFLVRPGAMDAARFAEPERFDPERWLRADAASAKRVSMPFGAGPRMCPGRYLALLEIKMAVATLLARFDVLSVEAGGAGPVQERLGFTMQPTPLRMRRPPR